MWRTLRHPNVLPLLGVEMTGTRFAIISEWMDNGNINDFVKANPGVNRLELVGCQPRVPFSSLRIHQRSCTLSSWQTLLEGCSTFTARK